MKKGAAQATQYSHYERDGCNAAMTSNRIFQILEAKIRNVLPPIAQKKSFFY